jgi:hypothetical protein
MTEPERTEPREFSSRVKWPDGKLFAFTVFDDTDLATVDNVAPVYALLKKHGFRTTKSVWPIRGERTPRFGGSTCEDAEYRQWLYSIKEDGFEIGLHNATYHSSERRVCMEAIEQFENYFGHPPFVHANHVGCADGIYWGGTRFTGMNKVFYTMLSRGGKHKAYQGHVETSKYFWGDVCRNSVKYVRDFVFTEINTLKACPYMPYHDDRRPYVNNWFGSAEGANVDLFNETIAEEHQDRLEEEGGACIMYTHFASGFYKDGMVNDRFEDLIARLGRKKGWFVPVHVLLDYLLTVRGSHSISVEERKQMERKFLWDRTKLRLLRTGQRMLFHNLRSA